MTNDNQTTGTINGSPIVYQQPGTNTGDRQYVTADGRVWNELRDGVPTSVPTGNIIATIRRPTND